VKKNATTILLRRTSNMKPLVNIVQNIPLVRFVALQM